MKYVNSKNMAALCLALCAVSAPAETAPEDGEVTPRKEQTQNEILQELYEPGDQSQQQSKENPFFSKEADQRRISGSDQSVLSPFKRNEVDTKAPLLGRFESGPSARSNRLRKGINRRSARNLEISSGYGLYNNFLFGMRFGTWHLLEPLSDTNGANPQSNGAQSTKAEKSAPSFQPIITYNVNYLRQSAESDSNLETHVANSARSMDDLQMATLLQMSPNWRQKYLVEYFGLSQGLQGNRIYADSERRGAGFGWQNNIRSGQNSFFVGLGYNYFRHDFHTLGGDEKSAERHAVNLDGQAKFKLGSRNQLIVQSRLHFFENRSDWDPSLNNGLPVTGYFTDSISRLEAGFKLYDRFQALKGTAGYLDLLFGISADGAFGHDSAVGPFVGIHFGKQSVWSTELEYVYRGAYPDYAKYFLEPDFSQPGQDLDYTTEHLISARFAWAITKSVGIGFDTNLHLAENYPLWRTTQDGLFTPVGVTRNLFDGNLFVEFSMGRALNMEAGVMSVVSVDNRDLYYIPQWVPYIESEFRLVGFSIRPRLRYVSSQLTDTGNALDPFFDFDLRIERQIYDSLHGFLYFENIFDEADGFRAAYQAPGLTISAGAKMIF